MSVDLSTLIERANAREVTVQFHLAELFETDTGIPVDRGQAARHGSHSQGPGASLDTTKLKLIQRQPPDD